MDYIYLHIGKKQICQYLFGQAFSLVGPNGGMDVGEGPPQKQRKFYLDDKRSVHYPRAAGTANLQPFLIIMLK